MACTAKTRRPQSGRSNRQQELEDVDRVAGADTWAALDETVGMVFTEEEAAAAAEAPEAPGEMVFTVEEAQAPPSLPGDFCAPLRPQGRGAFYAGGGSRAYMRTELQDFAAQMREQDYPALAQGAELMLALAPMEGWMSAINTWDNKVLTWGSGFAHNGGLDRVWTELDGSVQSFLSIHAPDYFAAGLSVTDDIRRDAHALSALVYVAEHDPYRRYVLRAMLRAFLADTVGITELPDQGEELPGGSLGRARLVAVRLQHWLPAYIAIPGDLTAVAEAYGSDEEAGEGPSAAEVRAAADLMVRFGRRFLDSARGRDRAGGGRIQQQLGFRATVKFQRIYARFFGDFDLPAQATATFPGLTSGSTPYLQPHDSEDAIDRGHDVLVHHVSGQPDRYVDLGAR